MKVYKVKFTLNKMNKYLSNVVAGRRKVIDEDFDLKDLTKYLEVLPSSSSGNLSYICLEQSNFEINPKGADLFVSDQFKDKKGYFFKANHKVYEGKGKTKHYFELAQEPDEKISGKKLTRILLPKKLTISFLVKKSETEKI